MKKTAKLVFAFLALTTLALSSCNTIAGVGRDMQSAGEAIQNKAQ